MSFVDQWQQQQQQQKKPLPPPVPGSEHFTLPRSGTPGPPVVDPRTGEEYPSPQSNLTKEDVGRFALEAGGSMAGLLVPEVGVPLRVARLLGPNITTLLTEITPKAFASGAGAGAGSLAAETFDPSPPTPRYLPSIDPVALGLERPTSPAWEAAQRAALLGAAGEVSGQVLGRGITKITEPPKLQPGVPRAQELLGQYDTSLTAGQGTKSNVVDVLENLSEAGFFTSKSQLMKERSTEAAQAILQDIVHMYPKLRGDAGARMATVLERRLERFKRIGEQQYRQVDQLLQAHPITVDIQSMKLRAAQLHNEFQLKDPQTDTLLKQILAKPNQLSFTEAQRLRSELLGVSGDPTAMIKGRRQSVSSLLAQETDQAMETAGAAIPANQPAYQAWRKANAYWKGTQPGQSFGIGVFRDPVVRDFITKDPGIVLDTFFAHGQMTGFKKVLEILPEPARAGLRREFLERALSSSYKEMPGHAETRVSGRALEKELGIADPYSTQSAVFRDLFPAKDQQQIRDVVQTLRLTQSESPGEMFTFSMRGAQIGAAIALASAERGMVKSALVMLSAPVAAFMVNNRVSRHILLSGFKYPPGTPEAINAVGKFLLFAREHNIPVTPSGWTGQQPGTPPPTHLQRPAPPMWGNPPK